VNIKIDISENIKFVDKISILGMATDDKSFQNNVFLASRTKKRIPNYPSKSQTIHAILFYYLVKII
jgi:hypothetical protein